jgi:tRNA uridine 5-carboxymethylaminomethyl modification enzyme
MKKRVLSDKFSYSDDLSALVHQRSCHMTYTSLDVHDILREGFDRSPCLMGGLKSCLDIVLQ